MLKIKYIFIMVLIYQLKNIYRTQWMISNSRCAHRVYNNQHKKGNLGDKNQDSLCLKVTTNNNNNNDNCNKNKIQS